MCFAATINKYWIWLTTFNLPIKAQAQQFLH